MRNLFFSNNIPLGFGILAGVIAWFGLLVVLMGMGIGVMHNAWVIIIWSAAGLIATILGLLIASVDPTPTNNDRHRK